MTHSQRPATPAELIALYKIRMPNSLPLLTPEQLEYAELVSQSYSMTVHFYSCFYELAQFLVEVDRFQLEDEARRNGTKK